ncbi:MAG: TonB family protein [Saprospirales bacterium]|nr:TonB family protein [Saprospirales bacterium]
MNTDLSFSSGTFVAAIFFAALIVIVSILIIKSQINKREKLDLTAKYRGKTWESPLVARVKYPDVDTIQYQGPILRMSLAIVLALIIFAFNWTTYDKKSEAQQYVLALDEEIAIEPPRSQDIPPPPPPPPPPMVTEVVVSDLVVEDEIEFTDQSIEAETKIDAPKAPTENKPPPPPPPKMKEPDVEEIFKIVEQMPRFPGCDDFPGDNTARSDCANKKLMEFIYANIQYPAIARENNVEGTVVVQFVVDQQGRITDAKVVRDIGAQCGEEALRIVEMMNSMPEKWTPGKQRGRPVKVLFMLPVKFKLL